MRLHARNFARSVGVPTRFIEECVQWMEQKNNVSEEGAKEFLKGYKLTLEIKEPKL